MLKVGIIGAGKVGTAMAYLLKQKGYNVVGVASRTFESAKKAKEYIGENKATTDLIETADKADVIFITTSDDAIEYVCNNLSSKGCFKKGNIVFHMSGALPSEILSSARDKGAYIASFHPLQSIADVKEAVNNFPGSYFCIEGDEKALLVARDIIKSFDGKEIKISVDKKPLYHAGASIVSNFLVATVGYGLEIYEAAGINRKDSLNALIPLIKGTVRNIERLGIPEALTGPISRGDLGVIEDHLKAISEKRPDTINLYSALTKYTVKVALDKGTINKGEADKIISLLDEYKNDKGDK